MFFLVLLDNVKCFEGYITTFLSSMTAKYMKYLAAADPGFSSAVRRPSSPQKNDYKGDTE